MTFFNLQISKITTWMNYFYPVNSILWKFELINKIFLQILFAIKKHIMCCKLFLAKIIRFKISKPNLFFLYDTIHIFFFTVRCYLFRRTHWVAFLTAEIIFVINRNDMKYKWLNDIHILLRWLKMILQRIDILIGLSFCWRPAIFKIRVVI